MLKYQELTQNAPSPGECINKEKSPAGVASAGGKTIIGLFYYSIPIGENHDFVTKTPWNNHSGMEKKDSVQSCLLLQK